MICRAPGGGAQAGERSSPLHFEEFAGVFFRKCLFEWQAFICCLSVRDSRGLFVSFLGRDADEVFRRANAVRPYISRVNFADGG